MKCRLPSVHTRRLVDGAFDDFHTFDLNTLGFPPTPQYYENLTVRFHQYDNFSAPRDGIAVDDIRVTGRPYRYILVEAPAEIDEDIGMVEIAVVLQPPPAEEQTILIEFPGVFQVPFTAEYPAGSASTTYEVPFLDDDIVNLDRNQTVRVRCDGYDSAITDIRVIDDEPLLVSVQLADVVEGAEGVQGGVRLNHLKTTLWGIGLPRFRCWWLRRRTNRLRCGA